MATYERVGEIPARFSIMVRWTKASESAVAKKLFAMPLHAPEIIRRVLEEALASGRLDAIASEVSSTQEEGVGANPTRPTAR